MRRSMISIILFLVLLVVLFKPNDIRAAEQYPVKPITFIVPVEAGGAGDLLARPLCQIVSEVLGKSIIIVNKPGGGTTLGGLEVLNAKPDGYVIGLGLTSMITSHLGGLSRLHFKDFTHLGTFYIQYLNVFGSTKTKRPFNTIQEVISFAKSHPGEVSLASSAKGQADWVGAIAFLSSTGIDVNVIPQAGSGGLAITQIAGGHADLAAVNLVAAKSQMDAGNVRFLAVIGNQRAPGYENVPTLKEIGYDVVWASTGFVIGPPKMPKEITDKLTKVFEMAANHSNFHKFLLGRFATPLYLSPAQTIEQLDGQSKTVRDIMNKAGILKQE
jgi:tripartite-type tricarboxylate transporter receptor subunit TctC